MELLAIGEFSRQSRLSLKALHLYDERGLLVPALVDPDNGYRYYDVAQLDRAQLISTLRLIGVPLSDIATIADANAEDAATQLREYWHDIEANHRDRRSLVDYLVNRMNGKRLNMYDVTLKDIPERALLCLKRSVDSQAEVWALGKEVVNLFKERRVPGAVPASRLALLIYYGEVSADSDGPVEFCWQIPAEESVVLAARYPELALRVEPAHQEATIHFGLGDVAESQWHLASVALQEWVAHERREPSELGVRVVMSSEGPDAEWPSRDFGVALN